MLLLILRFQKCSLSYILNVEIAEISSWNHYFKCENVLYVTCLQRAEELDRMCFMSHVYRGLRNWTECALCHMFTEG